jgi:hypothetical protein
MCCCTIKITAIHYRIYMSEDLEEKKLLGSDGYAFAKLTEQ